MKPLLPFRLFVGDGRLNPRFKPSDLFAEDFGIIGKVVLQERPNRVHPQDKHTLLDPFFRWWRPLLVEGFVWIHMSDILSPVNENPPLSR